MLTRDLWRAAAPAPAQQGGPPRADGSRSSASDADADADADADVGLLTGGGGSALL
jgi:hypothetical protein